MQSLCNVNLSLKRPYTKTNSSMYYVRLFNVLFTSKDNKDTLLNIFCCYVVISHIKIFIYLCRSARVWQNSPFTTSNSAPDTHKCSATYCCFLAFFNSHPHT